MLDDASVAEFERSLASDPDLRATLELHRRIERATHALYSINTTGDIVLASPPRPPRPLARRLTLSLVAIAAAVLLAAGVFAWVRSHPSHVPVDQYYTGLVSRGWHPQWVCQSDDYFVSAVRRKLGASLLIPADSPGVALVGWNDAGQAAGLPLGETTIALLADAGPDHVLVLMDRAANDRPLSLPASSPLHLFRREVGPLVLYEITPRAEMSVIQFARKPASSRPHP